VLVSLGALFSISSALNATLYGGANVAYALAREGHLPKVFERKVWFGATEGLYITAALGLFFALFFDLGGVAGITSSVFMVIYLFVIASHRELIRRGEAPGREGVVVFAFVTVLFTFFVLQYYQFTQNPKAFWATLFSFAAALAIVRLPRQDRAGLHPPRGQSSLGACWTAVVTTGPSSLR